jgi:hypothetical protein
MASCSVRTLMLPEGSPPHFHDQEKHWWPRSRPWRCHKRTSIEMHDSQVLRPLPAAWRRVNVGHVSLDQSKGHECDRALPHSAPRAATPPRQARDEFAALHWITSSAVARSVSGMVKPRALLPLAIRGARAVEVHRSATCGPRRTTANVASARA